MEIVEENLIEKKIKEVAESFGWGWSHGRKDFHNLADVDGSDGKWHLFLDPVPYDANEDNTIIIYEGYFMLLSVSDIDQNYNGQKDTLPEDGKWEQNIAPKKIFLNNEFKSKLLCLGEFEIPKFKMFEIINFFDNNMDGVLVNFIIKQFL